MLLAITVGVILALFIMITLWCRAAMRAASRRAEAAAKRKLDAQTWAKVKASRRQAQNDLLDRLNADAEAAKPILSAPLPPKRPPMQSSTGRSIKSSLTARTHATEVRASRLTYDDDPAPTRSSFSMPSIPAFDFGSSDSYSGGGSCSSGGGDSGGGGGGD